MLLIIALVLGCVVEPESPGSESPEQERPVLVGDPPKDVQAPVMDPDRGDWMAVSCSNCTPNADGTITLHLYPPASEWTVMIGMLEDGPDGLANAEPTVDSLLVVADLPVVDGDTVVAIEADFMHGGTIMLKRDPPIIPAGAQGSTRTILAGNFRDGVTLEEPLEIPMLAGIDYTVELWISQIAGNVLPPESALRRLDVVIQPAP